MVFSCEFEIQLSSEHIRKWLGRAAITEANPFLAVQWWYYFFGETEPYPWKRIVEHFPVFKEVRL